jgi:single-strand DNA-binding protein
VAVSFVTAVGRLAFGLTAGSRLRGNPDQQIQRTQLFRTDYQEKTMTDRLNITGLVATEPRHLITSEGLPITSFRMASNQRRFDKAADKWMDGDTNWYTVTTFRTLAENTKESVAKGDRVIVSGTMRIRDWENDERTGTTVDIEADSIGHDLAFGTSAFTRNTPAASRKEPTAEPHIDAEAIVADPARSA